MGNTSSFLTCLFVGWKAKAVFCQTARAGLKHLSSLGEAGVSCGLESCGESHLLLVLSQRCLLFCRRPDFHPGFSRYWRNNCASRTTSGHGRAVLPIVWCMMQLSLYLYLEPNLAANTHRNEPWLSHVSLLWSEPTPIDYQSNWDLKWVWDQHHHGDWKLTGGLLN